MICYQKRLFYIKIIIETYFLYQNILFFSNSLRTLQYNKQVKRHQSI